MSWRRQICPKDGSPVEAFLVAGGHGEPRIYPKKCFYEGRGKCPKDKRKRVCEFNLPEDWKDIQGGRTMIAFKVDYDGSIKCLVAGCKGKPYRFNRNGKTWIKCPECGAREIEEDNLNLGDKEEGETE